LPKVWDLVTVNGPPNSCGAGKESSGFHVAVDDAIVVGVIEKKSGFEKVVMANCGYPRGESSKLPLLLEDSGGSGLPAEPAPKVVRGSRLAGRRAVTPAVG